MKLLQTHASFVFLAPPFVYKVKKAVNFGFLDFSTLEKRRYFCEREMVLNRRLCPRVYLGVVPISASEGRYHLGVGNEIVEYAVRMRKLSERGFFHRLVKRGEVGRNDLNRIATVLKRFYETQQPTGEIEAWGRIDRLRISTDENFRQTQPFVGTSIASSSAAEGGRPGKSGQSRALLSATLSRPAFEAIRHYTNRFYTRHRQLFDSRIREGRILDCHGDLHLEHIHITPRALHIYDCIEFNDRFRYVDVASDAAFLAMDLDYEKRPDLARHFATRMASALNDRGMPRLMDFYKCYRACVRGKVESLHSVAHAATDEEQRAGVDRARRYFQLALRYAVAGSGPLVLVVMGRVGSGKSALARALGAELGWEVLSSDHIRKTIAGLPLHQRGDLAVRKRLYSAAMTDATYDRMSGMAEARLRKGRSVILDATFSRREHRRSLARCLGQDGFNWRVLETRAGNAIVKQRLRARATAPDEVSDARIEDLALLNRRYEPPVEVPCDRGCAVTSTGPLSRTVTTALKKLVRLQVEHARSLR